MIVARVEAMPFCGEGRVVGPGRAGQPVGELGPDSTASSLPGAPRPRKVNDVVAVHRGEVHQLVRHLVVVLQRMHQRHRLDAEVGGQVQGEAEELGVAGGQGVVVGGAGDEVVRQVAPRAELRAMSSIGQVQFLEGEATDLADHAGDELVGRPRRAGAPRTRPVRRRRCSARRPRKPLASSRSATAAEVAQRVQGVADHQPHAGEGRVQPVDRRLAVLEVVQVDPAPLDPVRSEHRRGGTPVGLLDAGLVEDDPLQPADDVAGVLQLVPRPEVEVDRVVTARDVRQQVPVALRGISTMW